MKTTRGLVATLFGFLALGFGLMAVIYWAILSATPFSFSSIDMPLEILVVVTVICLIVYILASPESIGQAAGRRSTRLTANAIVAALVVVGIALAINLITGAVPTVRADLTAGKDFTLSAQTLKVLDTVNKQGANISAYGFFDPSTPDTQQQAQDLLREYTAHTGHLQYQAVNPVNAPVLAAQYGVNRYGVVAFTDGRKRELATAVSERDFTSAIVRLLQTKTPSVAFLTGHGERDSSDSQATGYSQAKQVLADNNYNTITWSLITSPTIDANRVDVLVIGAPTANIPDKDLQAIKTYLDAGGHALITLDPTMPANDLRAMTDLLKKYGVTPEQGWVVDFQSRYSQQDPTAILVQTYPGTPITQDLSSNHLPTAFQLSMGLGITTTATGFKTDSLVITSGGPPASFLRTDTTNQSSNYVQGSDKPGPITIAVSVGPQDVTSSTPITQTAGPSTRLVVFGDADWASNTYLSTQSPFANGDLFNNSVSWLAGANELVSIQPKAQSQPRQITLTGVEKNVVFTVTVLGLPLLVLLFGGLNWWRRR